MFSFMHLLELCSSFQAKACFENTVNIMQVTYDGTQHIELLRKHPLLQHPFGLAIFNNWLFITDWKFQAIYKAGSFLSAFAFIFDL